MLLTIKCVNTVKIDFGKTGSHDGNSDLWKLNYAYTYTYDYDYMLM